MIQAPHNHPPIRRGPQGAYLGAVIAVTALGALLLPIFFCAVVLDPSLGPGCFATLVIIGGLASSVILWLRRRQQREEAARAYALWRAEQERQYRMVYEAWFTEQRLAHEAKMAEQKRAHEAWQQQQERRQRLLHLQKLGDLLVKTPTEFEQAIADLLPSLGFMNVQHIGRTGDQGVDIQCLTPSGEKVIVQCKLYTSGKKVTAPEMRSFLGAREQHQASKGIFVTTSTFTQDAYALAQEHHLLAVDREMLTELIQGVQHGRTPQVSNPDLPGDSPLA